MCFFFVSFLNILQMAQFVKAEDKHTSTINLCIAHLVCHLKTFLRSHLAEQDFIFQEVSTLIKSTTTLLNL